MCSSHKLLEDLPTSSIMMMSQIVKNAFHSTIIKELNSKEN